MLNQSSGALRWDCATQWAWLPGTECILCTYCRHAHATRLCTALRLPRFCHPAGPPHPAAATPCCRHTPLPPHPAAAAAAAAAKLQPSTTTPTVDNTHTNPSQTTHTQSSTHISSTHARARAQCHPTRCRLPRPRASRRRRRRLHGPPSTPLSKHHFTRPHIEQRRGGGGHAGAIALWNQVAPSPRARAPRPVALSAYYNISLPAKKRGGLVNCPEAVGLRCVRIVKSRPRVRCVIRHSSHRPVVPIVRPYIMAPGPASPLVKIKPNARSKRANARTHAQQPRDAA